MQVIAVETPNLDSGVLKFILQKQAEFKMEKKRCVSLTYTINRLLKEGHKTEVDALSEKKQ